MIGRIHTVIILLLTLAIPSVAIAQEHTGRAASSNVIITLDETRPAVQMMTMLLVGIALWGMLTMVLAFRRNSRFVAWRATLFFMGRVAPVASIAAIVLLSVSSNTAEVGTYPWTDKSRVIETVIPLVMAIQAALLLSPDDEPALEVLLACPRRMSWLLLERLVVMFVAQSAIALVGVVLMLLVAPDQNLLLALTRWLPPALLLSGIGTYVTSRSRLAIFGVVIVGLVCFTFGIFGDFFLPGQPMFYPLNYLRPFLWPLNAYLQPGRLPAGDYWLNRIFVLAAGICLIMLAVRQLRDEEHILLGSSQSIKRKAV